MKRSVLIAALALIVISVLAFFWLRGKETTPQGATGGVRQSGAETVKLGAILFLTGSDSSYGVKSRRGYQLALDWGQKQGYKKLPKLVYGDSASSEVKGAEELKRLADIEDVKFIVGLTGSGIAQAVCPQLREYGVFVLEALDSAAALSGCSPYFFRIYPSDVFQGRFLADWSIERRARRAAIVYIQNAWGEGMAAGVRERFEAQGGDILFEEGILPATTDFTSLILKTKNAEPDVLFLLIYPGNAKRWLEQAQSRGLRVMTLGGDALTGSEVAQTGRGSDGLMYSAPFPGEGQEYEAFAVEFKREFGEEPDVYAIKSYDALRLAVRAINSVDVDPNALRSYFLSMPTFQGIGGPIAFDKRGDIKEVRYSRYMYQNGKSQLIR